MNSRRMNTAPTRTGRTSLPCGIPTAAIHHTHGLFIGCLLSNLITGAAIWDVIFGSLATLIGAVGTYFLGRKVSKWLSPVPPIVANTLIIPFVLQYAYGVPDGIPFLMLTVGAGEVLSCGVLGLLILNAIEPVKKYIFSKET